MGPVGDVLDKSSFPGRVGIVGYLETPMTVVASEIERSQPVVDGNL